jgi:hypothetical protein
MAQTIRQSRSEVQSQSAEGKTFTAQDMTNREFQQRMPRSVFLAPLPASIRGVRALPRLVSQTKSRIMAFVLDGLPRA